MSKNKGSSKTYRKVKNRARFPAATVLALLIGLVGIAVLCSGIVFLLRYQTYPVATLILGVFLLLALFPAFYTSGIELDLDRKRFREYDGLLGKNKDAWIDVEDGDYLSIVGFSQGRGAMTRRASTFVHVVMSKVYFWSGDWHIELFQGHYDEALKFAKRFGDELGLLINDVNKNQNLSETSLSSNRGAF